MSRFLKDNQLNLRLPPLKWFHRGSLGCSVSGNILAQGVPVCVDPHRIPLWIPSVQWSQTLVTWERSGTLRTQGKLPLRSSVKLLRQLTCSCVWSGLALLGLGRTRPTLTTMPHRDWPRQALLSASGSCAPTPTAVGFAKEKTQIGLNLIFCLRPYTLIIAHLCPPYLYNQVGEWTHACTHPSKHAYSPGKPLHHYLGWPALQNGVILCLTLPHRAGNATEIK